MTTTAQKAMNIRNKASVNENNTRKQIEDLIAEREQLINELKEERAKKKSDISSEEIDKLLMEHEKEVNTPFNTDLNREYVRHSIHLT